MTVSISSVVLTTSNAIFLVNWYTVHVRLKTHPLRAWLEAIFLMVATSSTVYHSCIATDIAWCPQDEQVLLSLDTFATYMAVPATFVPYYLSWMAGDYMVFMTMFNYLIMMIFMDSFWTIFILVPVSAIPFIMTGQMKYSITHPCQRWKSFLSTLFGLGAIYFRYMASTYPDAEAYKKYHGEWHLCAGLSSEFFLLDIPTALCTMYKMTIETDFNIIQHELQATARKWNSITQQANDDIDIEIRDDNEEEEPKTTVTQSWWRMMIFGNSEVATI